MGIRDSYNGADYTINAFKIVAKAAAADSVEFPQIQVYAEDAVKTKTSVSYTHLDVYKRQMPKRAHGCPLQY